MGTYWSSATLHQAHVIYFRLILKHLIFSEKIKSREKVIFGQNKVIKWFRGQRLYPLFFFSFIFISWRLITLQYCSGFCHTLTWISHRSTCIPHLDLRHSQNKWAMAGTKPVLNKLIDKNTLKYTLEKNSKSFFTNVHFSFLCVK